LVELLDNTKLIPVPKELADRFKVLAGRLGVSVSSLASEVLEEALRVDKLGYSVRDAVDVLSLALVHRGAGLVCFQRRGLVELIQRLYEEDQDGLRDLWYRAGRWYAAYLSSRLDEQIFGFFERDMRLSWCLDESMVRVEDVVVYVRFTSFGMSDAFTDLLVVYSHGFFEWLGYSVVEEEVLPGLVSLRFIRQNPLH